jgi:hypothetical protein
MKAFATAMLLCATQLCSPQAPVHAAGPALPQRDLSVELRQVEQGREDGGTHFFAGSQSGGDTGSKWEPQQLLVRNGGKATLRLNDSIPMQWTQSVSAPNPGGGANSGASVTNALVWFDAGQSLSVQPRWPGGKQPAVVEIEAQRASVDARMGADLPRQTRHTLSTTVSVPLGEWVTLAATGALPRAGVYSSEAGLQVRRLLQIRVVLP